MVEDNTSNGEDTANRKRGRLFGGRKRRPADESSELTTETGPTGTVSADAEQAESSEDATVAVGNDSPAFSGAHPDEPGLEPSVSGARASETAPAARPSVAVLFQAPDLPTFEPPIREQQPEQESGGSGRRRTRRRSGEEGADLEGLPSGTVVKVRTPRERQVEQITEPQRVKGSTRLEAKKQRRRDGREAGRRRQVITEAEFLARREAVDRVMVVRSKADRIQIAVLEDGVLVEHYVARSQEASLIGNVYLGRVQNVLPSMEAAFVDIGRGRNAVLYSGEVDWEAAAGDKSSGSTPRRIELALKPGDPVLVQVTKDPVGHKGARLTSQVSLPGRYLVYVPNGSMNGISRKLPDTERARLKKILKEVLPENVGVIVRTAAEGATEEQLTLDVNRLTSQWTDISTQVQKAQAPALLHSEPDLLIKIVRDVFNEDFHRMVIAGDDARGTIESYLRQVAPDLIDRVEAYAGERDAFDEFRVTEQIEKALDRKVFLSSGGSLVIDRTEAMTVVDVNTGKFVGSGGNLEETVTRNNLEAADEIVRQLRLRDIGGIIVVDFIDMVLESNRDLVLRRLVECLSRDRTKHQVAEVTSLGLVQMTRKKLGLGLLESFSEPCEVCAGRGIIVHHDPVVKHTSSSGGGSERKRGGSKSAKGGSSASTASGSGSNGTHAITDDAKNALAKIAASTLKPADKAEEDASAPVAEAPAERKRPRSGRGGRGSRRSESAEASSEAATVGVETIAPADAAETADVPVVAAPEPVEIPDAILDIPVEPKRQRRQRRADTETILDSVLESLPEPSPAGEGRAKRRRVTTSALTAPVEPEA